MRIGRVGGICSQHFNWKRPSEWPLQVYLGHNTLAGLLLYKLNHIPKTGEIVSWKKFEFEVIDMDNQRIDKIMISLKG